MTEHKRKVSLLGIQGANGVDGTNGKDGADGQNGKDGQNGQDGADGIGIKGLETQYYLSNSED